MGKVPAKKVPKNARSIAKPFAAEIVDVDSLRPHPRNYRGHPDDQLEHLVRSLKRFGVYRNVVAAKDGTILAGHGVVEAARKLGLKSIPIIRLNVAKDSPEAIKVLVGDNEVEHLAEQNDRLLSELLKEIKDKDIDGLLGTGFDEMMLANFVMVTRPENEIADFDAAAQWVGVPEYESSNQPFHLLVSFRSEKARTELIKRLKLVPDRRGQNWGAWYPPDARMDRKTLNFSAKGKAKDA